MKILFATDGSTHSDTALENILSQPWPDGSQCRVLTVAAKFGGGLMIAGIGALATQAEAALKADLQKMLAESTAKLEEKFGKTNVTSAMLEGHPSNTIVDEATNWSADLIVVGSHGTSGYNDEALGSTTVLVGHHAPCSVQIVHNMSDSSVQKKDKQHLPFEEARFLLAVHDSSNSQAVVETVLSRPWPAESLFQIVAIVPEPKNVIHSRFFKDPVIDAAHKEMYAAQKQHLEQLVSKAGASLQSKFGKEKVSYHVLEGNVPSLILQIAQDWSADMIFIGAHDRHNNIFEQFMGSVTRNVVRNSDCSVEIVRSHK